MAPKKQKIFELPYCWVENCVNSPEVETKFDTPGPKIGVCTTHKAAWLNLIKFLSKWPNLAVPDKWQKKRIVNLLCDSPGLDCRRAYNYIMNIPEILDLPGPPAPPPPDYDEVGTDPFYGAGCQSRE